MTSREKKDKIIAAAVTFTVALAVLLILFFSYMPDESPLAEASIPEPAALDVTYIEPELDLSSPGETEAEEPADDAPQPPGEPEPLPVVSNERIEPGPSPTPAPVSEPKTTQKRPSPVKETPNSNSEAEKKKISGDMAGKFSKNGAVAGKNASVNGQGKVNAKGSLSGRKFNGCPTSAVAVKTTVSIKVNVTVGWDGKVKSAKAVTGPSDYRAICERWARGASWSEKKGAPDAKGSITFTITPRL
ncbi:MAG: hypothetical protein NC328_07290 [Muribaculum sp.]|nr:hypothetical protein [Muribaculum sp.]